MLSKSSKYAIRAVLYLTLNSSEEKKFSPLQIADEINIPAPFLAKTLQQLTKHRLISSAKGRNGGFYLTNDDKQNTIISIIECIDGQDKIVECFLGLPTCSDENPCAIHHLVAPMRNNLVDELTNNTIEEFCHLITQHDEYVI